MIAEDLEDCTVGVVQERPAAAVAANGAARRRAADARKRKQNLLRISVWVRPEVVALLDLSGQQGRSAAVEQAVRHLAQQAANGLASGDGLFESIGLRLSPDLVSIVDKAGAAAGHSSRTVTVDRALRHVLHQIGTGQLCFPPRVAGS